MNESKKNNMKPYFAFEKEGKWFKLPMLRKHIGMSRISTMDAVEETITQHESKTEE